MHDIEKPRGDLIEHGGGMIPSPGSGGIRAGLGKAAMGDTMTWHERSRGRMMTAIVCFFLIANVVGYLVCFYWPIVKLWSFGDAYSNGHSARSMLYLRILIPFLFVFGGACLALNLILLACVWCRKERRYVLGMLIVALVTGLAAGVVISPRDYSNERWVEGLRDRFKEKKLDYVAIRAWMAALPKQDPNSPTPTPDWPAELRKLEPIYIDVVGDERNQIVLTWGGPWDSWSLSIGPSDWVMKSDSTETIAEVEPGVFAALRD